MELASNITWAVVSLVLLGLTWRAARAGTLRVRRRSAMLMAALFCLLLLPVISTSDDLMELRQAPLPASAQTWHLASGDASSAIEIVPTVFALLALLEFALLLSAPRPERTVRRSAHAVWNAHVRGLRPPPFCA